MMRPFTCFLFVVCSFSCFAQIRYVAPSGDALRGGFPLFKGCEQADDPKACSETRFTEYLSNYLHYPAAARAQTMEGSVVFELNVFADGSIESVELLHDPGYNLGSATQKAIERMARDTICWTSGQAAKIAMPVVFYFQNGQAWLKNLDQLFCEHYKRFENQEVSIKQLKKLLKSEFSWNDNWYVALTGQHIQSLTLQLHDQSWTFKDANAFRLHWLGLLENQAQEAPYSIRWISVDADGRQFEYEKTLYLRKSYQLFSRR
ncbi:MAG: TonB family protein [Bacteroidota bacterium]